jgi:Na+-translocating ferredoxin:NAD+ oxidoreductase subunit D
MPKKDDRFVMEPIPHLRDTDSTTKMMWTATAALAPLAAASVWIHGLRTAWMFLSSSAAAVLTEWAWLRVRFRRPCPPPADGSATLTGVLLAMCLPVGVPAWMPAAGAALAVSLGKQAFGGLGSNPLNPALLGRLLLSLTVPSAFAPNPAAADALTAATPLARWRACRDILTHADAHAADRIADATLTLARLAESIPGRFIAHPGACPGETSALLVLFGAGLLLYRRVIGWKIPIAGLLSAVLLFWAVGGTDGAFTGDPLLFVPQGGFLFVLFFMATDPVTSPIRPVDRWLFGAGFGCLTVCLRLWGPWAEGAGPALLILNGINAVCLGRIRGLGRAAERADGK